MSKQNGKTKDGQLDTKPLAARFPDNSTRRRGENVVIPDGQYLRYIEKENETASASPKH